MSDENLGEFVRATPDIDLIARRIYVILNYSIYVVWTAKLFEPFRHTDPQKASWLFQIRSDDDEMPSWLLSLGLMINGCLWLYGFVILVWHCGAVSRLALHSGAYDSRLVLPDGAARLWSASKMKQGFADVALSEPTLLITRQFDSAWSKALNAPATQRPSAPGLHMS